MSHRGEFEEARLQQYFHPNMLKTLKQKREALLSAFSPSHSITWKKHQDPSLKTSDEKAKNASSEKEMEVVTMRAAPFDKGGTVVQIAIRFRTYQSLEVRDERGVIVSGSHEHPKLVMEVSVTQLISSASEKLLTSL